MNGLEKLKSINTTKHLNILNEFPFGDDIQSVIREYDNERYYIKLEKDLCLAFIKRNPKPRKYSTCKYTGCNIKTYSTYCTECDKRVWLEM